MITENTKVNAETIKSRSYMTPHASFKKGDYSDIVLLPFVTHYKKVIAETYLENVRQVNYGETFRKLDLLKCNDSKRLVSVQV